MKNKTYNKKKIFVVFICAAAIILALVGRLVYLMVFDAQYYQKKAEALHEREREIKAARAVSYTHLDVYKRQPKCRMI